MNTKAEKLYFDTSAGAPSSETKGEGVKLMFKNDLSSEFAKQTKKKTKATPDAPRVFALLLRTKNDKKK